VRLLLRGRMMQMLDMPAAVAHRVVWCVDRLCRYSGGVACLVASGSEKVFCGTLPPLRPGIRGARWIGEGAACSVRQSACTFSL